MAQIITGYETDPQDLINSLMERVPVGDADELHSALIALARIIKAQQQQIKSLQVARPMEQERVTIEQIRQILQEGEDAAFGLSENGGTPDECAALVSNAVARVFYIVGR